MKCSVNILDVMTQHCNFNFNVTQKTNGDKNGTKMSKVYFLIKTEKQKSLKKRSD